MKTRHILFGIALTGAAWLALFGDRTPTTKISEAITPSRQGGASAVTAEAAEAAETPRTLPRKPSSPRTRPSVGGKAETPIIALEDRSNLIGEDYAAGGLFRSQNWLPPPPKPLPPPPPSAPPLPFSYLGKKIEDGVWEVYLNRGGQSIIAREKTVIDNLYRVEAIKPPALSLTYLPLNQAQSLIIGGIE